MERKSVIGRGAGHRFASSPRSLASTPNVAVMHQVVKAQLAAKRAGTQSTKTRKEVRGGGKKPFRQKGTGGARQGTIRAPHYPGGGIALGPKPRSYEQKTPKKMIRLALYSALSDRAQLEQIVLLDGFSTWSEPKTKDAVTLLETLGLEGKILVVLARDDETAAALVSQPHERQDHRRRRAQHLRRPRQ